MVVIASCHRCYLCFLWGCGCLVSLLLPIVLPSWSCLPATIAIIGCVCASSMVMVACHHCYCWSCFFYGHGCLVPSLLLLLTSWLWSIAAIPTIYFSFVVMVTWHHHYYCYFLHGHGNSPSMLLLTSLSWLFTTIITTIVSFMVMVA